MKYTTAFINLLMNFIVRLIHLTLRPYFLAQITARRQLTNSTKIQEKWKAKWNNFVQKTDLWKSRDVDGLWGCVFIRTDVLKINKKGRTHCSQNSRITLILYGQYC